MSNMNQATTLHILSRAPSQTDLGSFKQRCVHTDSILLTGDACYLINQLGALEWQNSPQFFTLSSDAQQRGLDVQSSAVPVHFIDMKQFVHLSLNHQTLLHW